MSDTTCPLWADQMSTGLALVGADLRLRWLNPSLAERLGLWSRGAAGQPLAVLLADPDATTRAAQVLVRQQAVQWRDAKLCAPGGREFEADLALQPFADGLLLEVHVLAPPLSTASPLSATLRGFAHEVKNPLAGLRGAAQLLQRRADNDDLRALAGLIIDEADRLGALANRLLHHDGEAKLDRLNIHQVLERLTDLLQVEPSPPRLRPDYDPSVPDLFGDADRLYQVLLNLARNALEAGARALIFRTRIEHGVRLGERMLRMVLRVDVVDDGPGIPVGLRDTLFEPLVSGRTNGTGLGLALSREIVHEHGGELRCSSRPGETVFSLYLPLEKAHG